MERAVLIGAIVILALSSCGLSEPHLSVLRGNHAFGQGRFPAATVHYLAAIERGQFAPWIAFNLGNVYHALGENESALGMWKTARDAPSEPLRFAVHFNTGVLLFDVGRYRDAYQEFVAALRLQPGSVSAKINLELSLARSRSSESVATLRRDESPDVRAGSADEARRILQFIRQREEPRWFAVEEIVDQDTVRGW